MFGIIKFIKSLFKKKKKAIVVPKYELINDGKTNIPGCANEVCCGDVANCGFETVVAPACERENCCGDKVNCEDAPPKKPRTKKTTKVAKTSETKAPVAKKKPVTKKAPKAPKIKKDKE